MLERMYGSGKITAQLKTAGTGAGNTRAGLKPLSDCTGRSPGAMMPRAGRAMSRAFATITPAAAPRGGR